jgi:hypothetical protein
MSETKKIELAMRPLRFLARYMPITKSNTEMLEKREMEYSLNLRVLQHVGRDRQTM